MTECSPEKSNGIGMNRSARGEALSSHKDWITCYITYLFSFFWPDHILFCMYISSLT